MLEDVGKVLLLVMFLGLALAWGGKRLFDFWYRRLLIDRKICSGARGPKGIRKTR